MGIFIYNPQNPIQTFPRRLRSLVRSAVRSLRIGGKLLLGAGMMKNSAMRLGTYKNIWQLRGQPWKTPRNLCKTMENPMNSTGWSSFRWKWESSAVEWPFHLGGTLHVHFIHCSIVDLILLVFRRAQVLRHHHLGVQRAIAALVGPARAVSWGLAKNFPREPKKKCGESYHLCLVKLGRLIFFGFARVYHMNASFFLIIQHVWCMEAKWISVFAIWGVDPSGLDPIPFESQKKTEVNVWLWYHQEAVMKQKKLQAWTVFPIEAMMILRDRPSIETYWSYGSQSNDKWYLSAEIDDWGVWT